MLGPKKREKSKDSLHIQSSLRPEGILEALFVATNQIISHSPDAEIVRSQIISR